MNRRDFLLTSAGALAAAMLLPESAASAPSRRKPNVVLIVADDLGYADLGAQGCKDIPTPHIDSIARAGVRFTDGYVSCPVCSPTRAGLMTGRYQQRFGHEFNPGPAQASSPDFGLSLEEKTLAERLKPMGYATGMFGKWHLGYQPQYHPTKRGFDEFFGFLGGAHSYLDANADSANPVLRGEKPVEAITYTTEDFAREAVGFIERHKAEPFFLYLPFNAVHMPLQTLEKYRSRFASIQDPKRRTYAGMLSAMDDAVGTVLAKLRELKLEGDTLLFFISDNGGPTPQTTSRNDPLRGYKGQVLEGGIRIPFMVRWPGHVPAGKVYRQPVISLDIHATVLAAVGGNAPTDKPLDGVDLLPYLAGRRSGAPHDRLFWRFGAQHACRMGDWKLVSQGALGGDQLYNLRSDIGEANDLAAKEPAKLKELQSTYDAWNAQLVAPKWGRGNLARRNRPLRPGRLLGRRRRAP